MRKEIQPRIPAGIETNPLARLFYWSKKGRPKKGDKNKRDIKKFCAVEKPRGTKNICLKGRQNEKNINPVGIINNARCCDRIRLNDGGGESG